MGNNKGRPPIIIIGMHRSGTSMITRLLERLGIFMGKNKNSNDEAFFFVNLNKWLLRQCGGGWDHPQPIYDLLKNPNNRKIVIDYLCFMMKTPQIASFLGFGGFLQYQAIHNQSQPWGWKDPRNTFTLPIWLELFSDAKVVHIYRHGVDVANSLKVRQDKHLPIVVKNFHKRKLVHLFVPKHGGFSESPRCGSLEGGFSLWEQYMTEAKKHVQALDTQAMAIQYENFLIEPFKQFRMLSDFCELNLSDRTLESAIASISVKKERAYVYQQAPELNLFAKKMANRLAVFGY